jgi:hypothetical protein
MITPVTAVSHPYALLERFAPAIRALPEELPEVAVRQLSLLLERHGPVEIYYAPSDYVNEQWA